MNSHSFTCYKTNGTVTVFIITTFDGNMVHCHVTKYIEIYAYSSKPGDQYSKSLPYFGPL